MAWNLSDILRAYQTGAASLCRDGATIRLFPTLNTCSIDERMARMHEKIRRTMVEAHKCAAEKVEESQNKDHS